MISLEPSLNDPAWLKSGRVPSLDGLRGISIILVLYDHCVWSFQTHFPHWMVACVMQVGCGGVDVFFVISGFLITLLLLRERQRNGCISLKHFYLRRLLRIVPAYFVYILCVGAALSFTSSALSVRDWCELATYTAALLKPLPWYVGQTWSLSVEEHFYLVWPIVFVMLGRRWLLILCAGYTFAAMGIRLVLIRHGNLNIPQAPDFFSPVRADAIAVGCALALVATSSYRTKLQPGAFAASLLITLMSVLLVASHFIPRNSGYRLAIYYHNFGYRFIVEWCVGVIVWCAAHQPDSVFGRFLNWRPLTIVGVLSYSIYLWHMPFVGPIQPFWMFKLPGNFLVIAILASASYLFVELPFLRLKSRFEPARGSNVRRIEGPVKPEAALQEASI